MSQESAPSISALPVIPGNTRLAALLRIGTSPIASRHVFVCRVEELAFSLKALKEECLSPQGDALLAELPRIEAFPLAGHDAFTCQLEDLAFLLGDLREERLKQKHPYWWRFADVLDDVMDLHDALSRPLR